VTSRPGNNLHFRFDVIEKPYGSRSQPLKFMVNHTVDQGHWQPPSWAIPPPSHLHVSALALGHDQVSRFVSEETSLGESPLRQISRPDNGPVEGPKHAVLAINNTPHY